MDVEQLDRQVRTVVARLDAAIRTYFAVKDYSGEVKPHPPASEQDIRRYEEFLGLRLPNTYRSFLRQHDGYDWLAIFGHMLPISELMPGGRAYERIVDWKRDNAKYGGGEVLDAIVIAELEEPNNYVYLDPNKVLTADDFVVVESTPEGSAENAGLIAYFEGNITHCETVMERMNIRQRPQ
jgi:cell wall assembly regulator SMI1